MHLIPQGRSLMKVITRWRLSSLVTRRSRNTEEALTKECWKVWEKFQLVCKLNLMFQFHHCGCLTIRRSIVRNILGLIWIIHHLRHIPLLTTK